MIITTSLVLLGLLLALAFYSFAIERYLFKVEHVTITSPNLPSDFKNLNIVQISDIHLGNFANEKFMMTTVNRIMSLNPDAVVITGDILDNVDVNIENVLAPLGLLKPPLGVYAVLGNHDYRSDYETLLSHLPKVGVTPLKNQIIPVQKGSSTISIVGLDDALYGSYDLRALFSTLPKDSFSIFLAHEPDVIDEFSELNIQPPDIQLSGHTHAGQVRIPFYGSLVLPRLGRNYVSGLSKVGLTSLYVNRGLGVSNLPFRFNCRPEITSITFQKTK